MKTETFTTHSKDGTLITYDRLGSGPAVILVSGAMIFRKFAPVQKLAELLSNRFTVYNYDRRGRFDSGNTLPYSPEREVEDLAAVLAQAGGSAMVYGLSSGAALVVRAASSGLSFEKIALYEAPYVGWDAEKLGDRESFISDLETLIAKNDRASVVKAFMKLVGVPGLIRLIMPLFSFWKSAIAIAHTIPYDLKILGDQKIPTAELKKIQAPALVMAGGLSSVELKNASRELGAGLTNARYEELPGQRHDASPEAQAAALQKFFAIGGGQ